MVQDVNHGAPQTYETLIHTISRRHSELGPRAKEVARYIMQNPNLVAVGSAKEIATNAGIHPSILVRFAQHFGFSGFSDMQRVFQSRLLHAAPGFNERLETLRQEVGPVREQGVGFLHDLVLNDVAALRHLADNADAAAFDKAINLMAGARTIYLAGQLRAYVVANYLDYVLTHLRLDSRLLDGTAGLAPEKARVIGPDSVLIAVSFRHYAREVVDIVEATASRNVPVIAITDSTLSPLAKSAAATLIVPDAEFNFVKSLAAPLCMAQALVIGLAHKLERQPDQSR